MQSTLFENVRIFDGANAECAEGMSVLIEGDVIREISDRRIAASHVRTIDLQGKTLMPGLIDLHTHAYGSDLNVQKIDQAGDPFRTTHAVRMLGHALDCGFTTMRDVGGGDWSLAKAIREKMFRSPRYFYAGKILSMTGGHGDFRGIGESQHTSGYCACGGSANSMCVMADGVPECLKAVREELRLGAHCIKIMGSGGVASPTDPIWANQYREDEIRAIVGECLERRTYVSAHCHPTNAIRRSVEFGVRCIEHGTLIDKETATYVAAAGAYVVPTLVTIFVLVEQGASLGLAKQSQEKATEVFAHAMSGLDIMKQAGVKIGFGSDLLGEAYVQQAREFRIRKEVFTPLEILRQATSVGAEILMQDGKLGCVAPGAFADLIVVNGDPLKDIELLAEDGRNLSLIMRAGEIVKDTLQ